MSDNLKYYIGRITPQIETITGANVMWNMYGVCVFLECRGHIQFLFGTAQVRSYSSHAQRLACSKKGKESRAVLPQACACANER